MSYLTVELSGFTCCLDYTVRDDLTTNYHASIYTVIDGCWQLRLSKAFGNGVAAENWLLDTVEYPSFVILQAK